MFFIDDIETLRRVLENYDYEYVVLPFYSGSTVKDNWLYYQAVPADSVFYTLLNDEKFFNIIETNETFTAYKKIFFNTVK